MRARRTTSGETPADLAKRMPAGGSYSLAAPVERSGLVFARLNHCAAVKPLEAGITPAADVLSLHLSDIKGRAWREGRLLHDGEIRSNTISLVETGVRSDVSLLGHIDIIHVFLPQETTNAIAAEFLGRPAHPRIDGWVTDTLLRERVIRSFAACAKPDPAERLGADTHALGLARHLLERHSTSGSLGRADEIKRGGLAPRQLRMLLDYMEENIGGELTLKSLAELVHLSRFHLIRAFQLETGLTPHHWLFLRRIARAKALLAENRLSLSEIAQAVGYQSQSSMTAAFTNTVGASPGRWRRGL